MSYLENYKEVTSHIWEARFAILDSTLTVPKYRVGEFRFCEKKLI